MVEEKKNVASSQFMFLAGGGEMGGLIRAGEWAQSPLGPIEHWPQSLKTSISLMLSSQHPIWIGWGPDATFLYNDAYIQVLSLAKHPWALGKPAAEVWKEIWHICGPLADKVFQRGEASFLNDVRLFMRRGDFLEETFYSFSYSPIRDESGNVGGLFCPSAEVTAKILNTRRLRTLSELAAGSLVEKSADAACASAAAILAKNRDDIPFALLYLIEDESAVLKQTVGLPFGQKWISPVAIKFSDANNEPQLWPLAEIWRAAQAQVVSLLGVEGFPRGAAEQKVFEALALPVISRGQKHPLGILIAGINPTRKLDDEYRAFFELVAGHIATAIQNARAAEEEKNRADKLAELDRAKTTFFSNVSHELRTPLTLILGPLEDELRERTQPSERLELAHRNSLRLLKLVNTLLDFARLEAGRVEASFEPADLAAFTAELASVFRSGAERAGLRLLVDCPPLPEPVYVDRDMWEKIVFNLLSNAFKFTLAGEIEIKLRLAPNSPAAKNPGATNGETSTAVNSISPAPCACLSVRDTGTGIPAAELPRIFERFHRVRNTRARSHEGTGIGLALVQELARLHGGCVGVESIEGAGTTFQVWIPLGQSHLPKERLGAARTLLSTNAGALPFVEEALRWLPENSSLQNILAASDGNDDLQNFGGAKFNGGKNKIAAGRDGVGARILLADDNSDMREYIRRLLVARGHEVVAVENGAAALEAIRAEPPALVLSDVMMPRLDGFGLLRELRNDPKTSTIPIILISARAGEEARVEGAEAGADDYLTKPFSARELLARVTTHLDLARIRREADEKIRATMESITDGLHVVDASGRFTYLNAAARRMISENGMDPDALIGRDYFEAFPATLTMKIGHAMKLSLTEHMPTETENFYTPWQRWFSVRHYPTAEGGVSTFFLDITERKRAEVMLRAGEQRFRQLADAMPQMVWITEADGRHEYFNRRWYEFTGVPDGSTGGAGWEGLFHPDDEQRVRAHWRKHLATGELYEIEYRLKHHAGGYCWFLCRAVAVRDDAGRIVKWFGTCTDIESVKRVEEALRDAKASAEVANKSKDRFLAALSHELRTPLTPVLMTAAVLREDERLPAEIREQLGMMERNIALEARLIDDLLDISAIAAGKLHLHLQWCDTHSLIRLALEIVRDAAVDKQIEIACELNAVRSGLMTDPARFQQVIWNLLRNAVKFTPRGGTISIRTREQTAGDGPTWLRLEVADSGIGIAPDSLEKIFRPFEQGAVTGNHRFGGLGLGLAIARAIVDLHGGKISAHSEGVNRGATIVVELPGAVAPPGIAEISLAPSASANGVDKIVGAEAAGEAKRILLVEDHEPTRVALANLLIRRRYKILAAGSVAEAREIAAREKIDFVISDIGLPDGSGNDLMAGLREAHGLKGIALTGYGMEEDVKSSLTAGFVTHLTKPINIQSLENALANSALNRPGTD